MCLQYFSLVGELQVNFFSVYRCSIMYMYYFCNEEMSFLKGPVLSRVQIKYVLA